MSIKRIVNQLKAHPIPIIFFIVAFVTSSALISIWTSNVVSIKSLALQKTEGIPENTLSVSGAYNKSVDFEDFADSLKLITDETNLTFQKKYVDLKEDGDESTPIILEYFEKTPIWRYPLIEGRDYSSKEVMNGEYKALVGKKLKDNIYVDNKVSKINVKGEEYIVTGIIGEENKDTPWDNDIYIPLNAAPKSVRLHFSGEKPFSFLIKNNINSAVDDANKLKETIELNGGSFNIKELDVQSDIIANYFIENDNLTKLTIIILIISFINMASTSIYWINERYEEIAIRKSFGIDNKRIIGMLAEELLAICLISFLLVLGVQMIMSKVIHLPYYSLIISIQNLFSGVTMSVIATIIALIIPIYYILKIQPIELFKK